MAKIAPDEFQRVFEQAGGQLAHTEYSIEELAKMTPEQLRQVIEGQQRQVLHGEKQQKESDTRGNPPAIPQDIIDQAISLDADQQQSQAEAAAVQIQEMSSDLGSVESPRATRARRSRSSSMETKRRTMKSP